MKYHSITAILLLLCILSCSCSINEPTSQTLSSSSESYQISESSGIPEVSSQSVSSENNEKKITPENSVSLPLGVTRSSDKKLSYHNSILSLSVTFPDEFYVQADDYQPNYGIYLQNDQGTATLLLQSVTDNTLTHKEMSEYLKKHYPDATVYISDKKEIIMTCTSKDISGNDVGMFQKIRVKDGGYNQIVLCCRPSQAKDYKPVFDSVRFS